MKSKKTAIIVRTQIQNLAFVISLQIVHRNTHFKEYKKFNDLTQMLKRKTYNKKVQIKTNTNQKYTNTNNICK